MFILNFKKQFHCRKVIKMKKILLLLILSSSIILPAKETKNTNFRKKNNIAVKSSVKASELTEDEELELFGYEAARNLESNNNISEEEKIEIRFELGLPMTE